MDAAVPMLDEQTLRRAGLESGNGQRPVGDALLPSPREPMAVARALVAAEHTETTTAESTLRRWRGGWWKWQRSRWVERDDRDVVADAYTFTEHATYLDDKDRLVAWAPNRYKIGDLLDALAAVTHLREDL